MDNKNAELIQSSITVNIQIPIYITITYVVTRNIEDEGVFLKSEQLFRRNKKKRE